MTENKSKITKNQKKYNKPKVGEIIRTEYGIAEIVEVKGYDEVVEGMEIIGASKDEIDHFTSEVEYLLKNRNEYF